MKRTIIFWKTKDMKRKTEVKTELGITSVSVNGESDYNGDMEKLEPYIREGLIEVRKKDYEERRIKEVCVDSEQSQFNNCKAIGCNRRKRKV